MMGLAILGAFALYLLISAGIVVLAVKSAKTWQRNPWVWGSVAALAMYLLVFWDHIPTLVMHKYYCEKEAGFWVYKTPEQWVKENPGVMETFVESKERSSAGDMDNFVDTVRLNQRMTYYFKKNGPLSFNRWRWELELVDQEKKEVLARYIDFSTGDGKIGDEFYLLFWLKDDYCLAGEKNKSKFYQAKDKFLGREK